MKLLAFLRALFVIPFALLLTLLVSLATLFMTLVLNRDAASIQWLATWWASSICRAAGVAVSGLRTPPPRYTLHFP